MNLNRCLIGMFALALLVPGLTADPAPAPAPSFRDQMIADLIKRLDSNKCAERDQATELLRAIGKPVVEPLKQVLATNPSLDVTTRVRRLLRSLTRERNEKLREIRRLMAAKISFPNGIENQPLRDVIDIICDELNKRGTPLTFVVYKDAFRVIGIDKVEEIQVSLQPMVDVRLEWVLQSLLSQVQNDEYTGTYLIQPSGPSGYCIEITSSFAAAMAPLAIVVDVDFKEETVADALKELAETSGIDIALDPREAKAASQPVTLALNRVSVNTAARLLADMAGLKSVRIDRLLYITSKKNALAIKAEQKEIEQMLESTPPADAEPSK